MSKGKRHNKMYITQSEWTRDFGGKNLDSDIQIFKKLPFNCCSLSLAPVEDAVCTRDGDVFDVVNILPWLKKHGKNPVTGGSLTAKDLIHIKFHHNEDGQCIDPVSRKVFTDHTRIVAIATSGNVYSYETVQEANLKVNQLEDLLTSEPFKREDIIWIQDPQRVEKKDYSQFQHMKQKMKEEEEKAEKERGEESALKNINVSANSAASRIFEKMKAEGISSSSSSSSGKPLYSSAVVSQNANSMASSFTSTSVNIATTRFTDKYKDEMKLNDLYEKVKQSKKKGYVRLSTNMGDLNVELDCDLVPKTCHNFILLCERGFYKNVSFHRSIKNFMLQGGDPTGKGTGGTSAWNNKFEDEIHPKLTHSGRGILSMANSGKNTNGSQFFILYKSAPHLDRKHSVFGKIVGGLDVLSAMEKVPTDEADRPQTAITIQDTTVFVNPYTDPEVLAIGAKPSKEELEEQGEKRAWFSAPTPSAPQSSKSSGIGKYLNKNVQPAAASSSSALPLPASVSSSSREKRPLGSDSDANKKAKSSAGDFSSW